MIIRLEKLSDRHEAKKTFYSHPISMFDYCYDPDIFNKPDLVDAEKASCRFWKDYPYIILDNTFNNGFAIDYLDTEWIIL